jgi:hypothetical protein
MMHVIVRLFVLLDLDWLARGARQGWRVPHRKRYNVLQYKIVFLQILVSLASHRRVSIFTCARATRSHNAPVNFADV